MVAQRPLLLLFASLSCPHFPQTGSGSGSGSGGLVGKSDWVRDLLNPLPKSWPGKSDSMDRQGLPYFPRQIPASRRTEELASLQPLLQHLDPALASSRGRITRTWLDSTREARECVCLLVVLWWNRGEFQTVPLDALC